MEERRRGEEGKRRRVPVVNILKLVLNCCVLGPKLLRGSVN